MHVDDTFSAGLDPHRPFGEIRKLILGLSPFCDSVARHIMSLSPELAPSQRSALKVQPSTLYLLPSIAHATDLRPNSRGNPSSAPEHVILGGSTLKYLFWRARLGYPDKHCVYRMS